MIYPWQQQTWQQLTQAWQQQRLAHALLFTGPKGMGKVEFAQAFSRLLLCQQPHADQACGQCPGCQLTHSGNHPDSMIITLEEKAKQIKVEQIRTLTQQLCQTAHKGGYQVVILFPADCLNRAAANALLKTLEEPSGQVLLMLVADQLATLPATIISRCQQVNFNRVSKADATTWLSQTLDGSADTELLLTIADQAPLRAKALVDADYISLRDSVLSHLSQVATQQVGALVAVDELVKADRQLLLFCLSTIAIDLLRLHYTVEADAIYNCDCQDKLKMLGQHINNQHVARFITVLNDANRLLASQANPNWQLLVEHLLLRWDPRA